MIQSLTGNEKKVNFSSIRAYKITATKAKAHLQTEMNAAISQTQTAFNNFLVFSTPNPELNCSEVDTIAALLAISTEEFRTNSEANQQGLVAFLTELKAAVANPNSSESRNHFRGKCCVRSIIF